MLQRRFCFIARMERVRSLELDRSAMERLIFLINACKEEEPDVPGAFQELFARRENPLIDRLRGVLALIWPSAKDDSRTNLLQCYQELFQLQKLASYTPLLKIAHIPCEFQTISRDFLPSGTASIIQQFFAEKVANANYYC